jgi:hypothetical protein
MFSFLLRYTILNTGLLLSSGGKDENYPNVVASLKE